nr:uncharacterized protein LOC107406326 [Ziziphus jujuba var. spinosa]
MANSEEGSSQTTCEDQNTKAVLTAIQGVEQQIKNLTKLPLQNANSDDDIEATLFDNPCRRPGDFLPNHHFGHPGPPPQPSRYNFNRETNYKIKIDLPTFDGQVEIESFLDRIHNVESFLDYMNISEKQQAKLVAYKPKGGASAWWEQLQANRRKERKEPVRSWHRMKQLLKAPFVPEDYDQILYEQYHSCQQSTKTVNKCTTEFFHLSSCNKLQETERQQVARYIHGLQNPIKEKLHLSPIANLNAAVNLANRVEKQMTVPGSATRPPHKWKPISDFYTDKSKQYHPHPKVGYRSSECPQRKLMHMHEEVDDYGGEDEHEGVDLIEAIEEICEVIIDGGTTENVVSKALVAVLNLPTKPHPEPYKIGWVKQDSDIKVQEMCNLTFSIGNNYVDTIDCDVIRIDVCHLLLGRPWLFDRDIQHNGKKDTYSFIWHNKKIVLLPPSSQAENSTKKHNAKETTSSLLVLTIFQATPTTPPQS